LIIAVRNDSPDIRRKAEQRNVDAGPAICTRSGERIAPGSKWDLDHHDADRSVYLGPAHARRNRAAASRHQPPRDDARMVTPALELPPLSRATRGYEAGARRVT
jgi:hypothetical protein